MTRPHDGLWTLCFGLSQFHGHDSWLVCEVALIKCSSSPQPMIGENGQLVIDELVEVQDYRKNIAHFRGIYKNMPEFNKGKPKDVNMHNIIQTHRSVTWD